MHHIYQTDGYILKTIPIKEADKLVVIFTKEFGLISATAQGIRYEKSKLRFAIQDYSKATVSLVRGKNDIWRLTNAQVDRSLYSSIEDNEKFKIIARVFKLLERLLPGEEVDDGLFNIIDAGINYLETNSFEREKLLDIESVFVLRILNQLGYIGNDKNINFYTSDNKWESEIIEKMNLERKNALRSINDALKQTQL